MYLKLNACGYMHTVVCWFTHYVLICGLDLWCSCLQQDESEKTKNEVLTQMTSH